MDSYNKQSTAVSNANQAAQDSYHTAMQSYNDALAKYQKDIDNKHIVFTSSIIQRLKLQSEPNATISATLLQPTDDSDGYGLESHKGPTDFLENTFGKANGAAQIDKDGFILFHCNEELGKGDVLKVTYTGLNNSYIGNKPIKKIVATYSQLTGPFFGGYKDSKGRPVGYIAISANPAHGTFSYRIGGFVVNYQYYDADGNLITFNKIENDGGGAWIAIGSLNRSDGDWARTEHSQLQSTGKAYGIYGSLVTPKSGNVLDADKSTDDGSLGAWDEPLDTPLAYKGAGLYHVWGDSVKVSYYSTGVNNDMWATISTIIPTDKTGIRHPPYPSITPPPLLPSSQSITPPNKELVPDHHHLNISYHSNTVYQKIFNRSYQSIRVIVDSSSL